jgi:hypothetical protein
MHITLPLIIFALAVAAIVMTMLKQFSSKQLIWKLAIIFFVLFFLLFMFGVATGNIMIKIHGTSDPGGGLGF